MQGAQPGIYSAFTDSPGEAAFSARCIAIRARQERLDSSGVIATDKPRLYRGEGRRRYESGRQRWDCPDLEALCQYFFENGFRARVAGRYSGTLQSQLLHQGYVEQPTVSLSGCRDVCAYYATEKHSRDGGGVVFAIDSSALSRYRPIYDSLATLEKTCPWVLGSFYERLQRMMKALDSGSGDVRESGSFLQRCHEESRRRVEDFGGGTILGRDLDWSRLLGSALLGRLKAQGISRADLDAMNEEFEIFWSIALEKMIGMDDVDSDGGVSRSIDLSRAYFQVFDEVRLRLREQWTLNRFSRHNHPGWDLSPFGYITKTIRDQEFFSDGDVPGDCVIEAMIVDKMGRGEKTIPNRRRRSAI
jgi:hypothetical protein